MKGFIEVKDIMLNDMIINVNNIIYVYCDSKIRLSGIENEIQLNESYEQIKQLIKEAQ